MPNTDNTGYFPLAHIQIQDLPNNGGKAFNLQQLFIGNLIVNRIKGANNVAFWRFDSM